MKFQYATIPLQTVIGLTDRLNRHADGYISDDAESRAFNELLNNGYRWIRSDGDVAVFEKGSAYGDSQDS